MRLKTTCTYCGKKIEIAIPRKSVNKSNPNYLEGYSCNDCVPENSLLRNGCDEATYTEAKPRLFIIKSKETGKPITGTNFGYCGTSTQSFNEMYPPMIFNERNLEGEIAHRDISLEEYEAVMVEIVEIKEEADEDD